LKNPLLYEFLFKNKLWLPVVVVLNILSGLARTAGASYLGKISDMIEARHIETLPLTMILGALIMVSAYIIRSMGADVCLYLSEKLALDIRLKIADKLKRMDLRSFEKFEKGDLQSVYRNDVGSASGILYIILSRILNNIALFVFSVLYMMSIDPVLTAIVTAGVLLMGVLNQYILNRIRKYQALAQKSLGEISSVFESGFSAIDLIKSYGAKNYLLSFFGRSRENYSRNMLKAEAVNAGRLTVYNISNTLAFFGSMIFLGYKGIAGEISVGQVLVYLYLIKQILVPVEVIFRWMTSVVRSGASWDRICHIINQADGGREKAADSETADSLSLVNAAYSYDGAAEIFRGLNLEVNKGRIMRISGRSGCGKTTLLKILLGLYRSPRTVIKLNGRETETLSGIAACASSADTLFPLSVYENIALGNERITREECLDLINRLGFGGWIASLPKGIDTSPGEQELSGGQRQMIVNARALLSGFPVIILDEPFSALDAEKEKLLVDELLRRKKSRIIMLTSHRRQPVEYEDTILAL
jgi:ABC-type multidrug transport system fused ATPase/permease subunit